MNLNDLQEILRQFKNIKSPQLDWSNEDVKNILSLFNCHEFLFILEQDDNFMQAFKRRISFTKNVKNVVQSNAFLNFRNLHTLSSDSIEQSFFSILK